MAKRILSILAVVCLMVGVGAFALIGGATDTSTSATYFEDFEGITQLADSKFKEYAGGEYTNASLVGGDSSFLISGTQSMLLSSSGGDVAMPGIGGWAHGFNFTPDTKTTISMKLKFAEGIPADFQLLLQVMAWTNGNWGDEIYLNAVDDKLAYSRAEKGEAVVSKRPPEVTLEDLGDAVYQCTATYYGVTADSNNAFFRLRPLGATACKFSVDDVQVASAPLAADELLFEESFDLATGFDGNGGIVGTKLLNFPRGSDTNQYHDIATATNEADLLISGKQSLVLNKPDGTQVESFAIGGNRNIRFDPEKRYVLTFTMKADGTIPTDALMVISLMNWQANNGEGHYSNELRFTKTADGFTVSGGNDTHMLDGAIEEKDGLYYVVAAFKGMKSTSNDLYSSFVRAWFTTAGAYTLSFDDIAIAESDADVEALLPSATVTTTTTEATTEATTDATTDVTTDATTDATTDVTTEATTDATTDGTTEATTAETTTGTTQQYSALGNPFFVDDIEAATGKVDGDAVAVEGTSVNWPFGGGQKFLSVVTSGDKVINGSKSVVLSTKGMTDIGFMTLNPSKAGLSDTGFSKDETYVMSYVINTAGLADDGYLDMVIRTWTHGDLWPVVRLVKDGKGGLDASFTQNKQDVGKVVVEKLDTDLFQIAVRFKGVKSSTACYPFWELSQDSEVVFDDIALYATDGDPALALAGAGEEGGSGDNVATGVTAIPMVVGAIAMAASTCTVAVSRKKRK